MNPDLTPSKAAPAATDAAATAMSEARMADLRALLEDAILWLGEDATVADLKDYDK